MSCNRKPTRKEKELLIAAGKRPESWLVESAMPYEVRFVSRTGKSRLKLAR